MLIWTVPKLTIFPNNPLKLPHRLDIGQLKLSKNFLDNNPEISNTNLFLRIGIYHGNIEISRRVDISVGDILVYEEEGVDTNQDEGSKQIKSKIVEFDLMVCNIPRMARLCFGLFKLR